MEFEFSQLEKRVLSPLILYIVLQDLYEGGIILHVCQYMFQNKS